MIRNYFQNRSERDKNPAVWYPKKRHYSLPKRLREWQLNRKDKTLNLESFLKSMLDLILKSPKKMIF